MKKKPIKLAGQVQHKSLNEAFKAVSDTMGKLHIETHERLKAERKNR